MGEAIGGSQREIFPQGSFGSSRHNALALPAAEVYAQKILANYLSYLQPSSYEGQEDQLGALGLVVNTIVLWNTRYMGPCPRPATRRGQGAPGRGHQASFPTDA